MSEDEMSSDDEIVSIAITNHSRKMKIILACTIAAVEGARLLLQPDSRQNSILTGNDWVWQTLNGHPEVCWNMLRMKCECFINLCKTLVDTYGLKESNSGLKIEEKVAMFVFCLAHGYRNRLMQNKFQHSGETISRTVHEVLDAMDHLARAVLKPVPCEERTRRHLQSRSFYRPFKDCIGAIDGTYVMIKGLPDDQVGAYYGRKGTPTQNIMAVCDFDLTFTYVSAGWEGSMHDSKKFNSVITDPRKKIPHPPPGKYYLVDVGYPSKKGYLGPYKGERYHHQIFRGGVRPRNAKERFNRAHSSLRSVIERTFGVLKKRWAFLENMPPYRGFDQVRLVCASMALHNFIRRHGLDDEHFQEADDQGEDYPYDISEEEQNFELGDMDEMETLRCGIANALSRQRSHNHNNS